MELIHCRSESRTWVPHRGRGHYQMTPQSEILSHQKNCEVWSKHPRAAGTTELPRAGWTGARAAASAVLLAHAPWEGPRLSAAHRLCHCQYCTGGDLHPLSATGDAHSRGCY